MRHPNNFFYFRNIHVYHLRFRCSLFGFKDFQQLRKLFNANFLARGTLCYSATSGWILIFICFAKAYSYKTSLYFYKEKTISYSCNITRISPLRFKGLSPTTICLWLYSTCFVRYRLIFRLKNIIFSFR